jgi:hypothetical protein
LCPGRQIRVRRFLTVRFRVCVSVVSLGFVPRDERIGLRAEKAVSLVVCLAVAPLVPKAEKKQKENRAEEAEKAARIAVCLSVVSLVPKGKKGQGQTCLGSPRSYWRA